MSLSPEAVDALDETVVNDGKGQQKQSLPSDVALDESSQAISGSRNRDADKITARSE
jgi:hypothetical protein